MAVRKTKIYKAKISGMLEIIPKGALVEPVSEIKFGQIKVAMHLDKKITDIFLIDDLEMVALLEEPVSGPGADFVKPDNCFSPGTGPDDAQDDLTFVFNADDPSRVLVIDPDPTKEGDERVYNLDELEVNKDDDKGTD